jgi:hypothetical protein
MSEKIVINSSNDEYSFIPASIMDQPISPSTTTISKKDTRHDCTSIPFAFKLVFGACGYYTEKRLYTFIFLVWLFLTALAYAIEASQVAPTADQQSTINVFFVWEQLSCDVITVFGMLLVVFAGRFGSRLTQKLMTIDAMSRSEVVRVATTYCVVLISFLVLVSR